MDLISLIIVALGFLAFSLVSGRLQASNVSAALLFIIFGFVIGAGGFNVARLDPGNASIQIIAEITLVLVLFSDAARIDLSLLRRDHNIPIRMLAIGLPLVMLMGTGIAALIFTEFSWWEAALLAALLAPTDAALGMAVVTAKIVPVRIRQAINVESGLNDGLVLPAVLFFAALASAAGVETQSGDWVLFVAAQLTLGPLIGVIFGWSAAKLLDSATERGWMSESYQGIAILSLSLSCYLIAESIGGNGFIAAFIGGLAFGNRLRHPCHFLFEFMETEGQLLMLVAFLVFGAAMLPEAIDHFTPMVFLYALLSLSIIRMLPIALSLTGSGLGLPSRLFLGWFGPRGLASILFVLLILERSQVAHQDQILAVVVVTVAMSALLHGITANPLAQKYGRHIKQLGDCEETQAISEMPLRDGPVKH